jgi:hypothetical protein
MIKKLTKRGNSYALIIDRGVTDLLQIDDKIYLCHKRRNEPDRFTRRF